MNPKSLAAWKQSMLQEILEAIAACARVRESLIFKGAHVLQLRLPELGRGSMDIDSNLDLTAFPAHGSDADRAAGIGGVLTTCLSAAFEAQQPQRYALESVKVKARPPGGHPRGWTMLEAKITVRDLALPIRGLPSLKLEMASPEPLTEHSVSPLAIGDHSVRAYTLERIAGEKMRALLSSLPTYCKKARKPHTMIRAKDVYDIACIARRYPVASSPDFWRRAASEFALTCGARFVDCDGWDSFSEDVQSTRSQYQRSAIIPAELAFDVAWANLREIVDFYDSLGVFPIDRPFPKRSLGAAVES